MISLPKGQRRPARPDNQHKMMVALAHGRCTKMRPPDQLHLLRTQTTALLSRIQPWSRAAQFPPEPKRLVCPRSAGSSLESRAKHPGCPEKQPPSRSRSLPQRSSRRHDREPGQAVTIESESPTRSQSFSRCRTRSARHQPPMDRGSKRNGRVTQQPFHNTTAGRPLPSP